MSRFRYISDRDRRLTVIFVIVLLVVMFLLIAAGGGARRLTGFVVSAAVPIGLKGELPAVTGLL